MTRPLSSRQRKWLLVAHITASVALVGSSAGLVGLGVTAATADTRVEAHAIYAAMQTMAFETAIPLSLLSLTTGVALGVGTRWGVVRHRWVASKLLLLVIVVLVGALTIGPWLEELVAATAAGPASATPRLGFERWAAPAAAAFNLALVVVSVGLAVFKPGGRLRRSDAPTGPRETTQPKTEGA
jgi:hypothetical protein